MHLGNQNHRAQLSFGRTVRITLNRAGTYSKVSETSSPNRPSVPSQSGHLFSFGCSVSVSRGTRPAEADAPASRTQALIPELGDIGCIARFVSRSSSRNSS